MKKLNVSNNNFNVSNYDDVYPKLAASRNIFITEEFTTEMSAAITALLLYYDIQSKTDDINIYINSPGGDAYALFQIYDTMNLIEAPIKTISMARAYSAGAFLLCMGTKGKRYAMKHSEIMLHGVQTIYPSSESNLVENEDYVKYLNNMNNKLFKIVSKQTGVSLKQITLDCDKDWYMTPTEALNYGIIDGII